MILSIPLTLSKISEQIGRSWNSGIHFNIAMEFKNTLQYLISALFISVTYKALLYYI